MPSSIAAAWSVQAASSATLQRASECEHRTNRSEDDRGRGRQQQPRRPPREARDEQERDGDEHEADDPPTAHPQQGAEFVGVVVDPIEDLSDRLLGQRRDRLAHHRVEEVGSELAFGAIDDAAPHHAPDRVQDRGADEADGELADSRPVRALGEPTDDHRAECLTDGGDARHDECEPRRPPAEPVSIDRALRRVSRPCGVRAPLARDGASRRRRSRSWTRWTCEHRTSCMPSDRRRFRGKSGDRGRASRRLSLRLGGYTTVMTDIDDTTTHQSESSIQTVVPAGIVDARVTSISPEAADEFRRHVESSSGGGNRFVWFLFGFAAALLAGVVASIVFLAVSDEDDDGGVQLDVPAVEVDVDG